MDPISDFNPFQSIKALLILDENAKRLFGRYYDSDLFPNNRDCHKFEQTLLRRNKKTLDSNDEIIDHFENYTVVARAAIDVYIFVIGDESENELTLNYLLGSIMEALNSITMQGQMLDKSQIMQNYSKVLIIFDEAVSDNGVLLEANSNRLIDRITEDRPVQITEDEMLNEIGNQTFKFFKSLM